MSNLHQRIPDLTFSPRDVQRLAAHVCRKDFSFFVQQFWETIPSCEPLIWMPHMQILCDEMQTAAQRVFANQPCEYDLVQNLPFGTSKSSVCSILFQPWVWTNMPRARFMTGTYTENLGMDLSSKSLAVIESEKYKQLYPEIKLVSRTASHFTNSMGGERRICTVGGKSPLGFHAHFLGLDDPIDPKGAMSQAEIDNAAHFWESVLPSRKVNRLVSFTYLIMQRLGRGDPSEVAMEVGRRPGAIPVRHICLPGELSDDVNPPEYRSIYQDGLLDPRRFPRKVLENYKARGALFYSAQVMQNPLVLGGGMFLLEYFSKRVKAAPHSAKRVRSWDRASSDAAGCFTAGVLMSFDGRSYFVEDCQKGQWEPVKRNAMIKAVAIADRARYGPEFEPVIIIEEEGGSTAADARRLLATELAGFKFKFVHPSGSKDIRAEPWSCQCAAGNVYLVDNGESAGTGKATWNVQEYVEEHVLFSPEAGKRAGKWKDQVDACLIAGTMVETSTGSKAIETIREGELVYTRKGLRKVLWSGQSGIVEVIASVLFSNSTIISGTVHHPVLTLQRGFCRIDELTAADTMLFWRSRCQRKQPISDAPDATRNSLPRECIVHANAPSMHRGMLVDENTNMNHAFLKGESIEGDCRTEDISGAAGNPCTELCGNLITEVYPVAIKFTTKTTTSSITRLKILNALPRLSTEQGIAISSELPGNWPTCEKFQNWLQNGIEARKEENGIRNTDKKLLEIANPAVSNVLNAENNFNRNVLDQKEQIVSVLNFVRYEVGGRGHKLNEHVYSVETVSVQVDGVLSRIVPENVLPNIDGTPVFNLEVEDCPEFFANGILVHNSSQAFSHLFQRAGGRESLRIIPIGAKKGSIRIVACGRDVLDQVLVTEPSLLIDCEDPFVPVSRNPGPAERVLLNGVHSAQKNETVAEEGPPHHALENMLGWVRMTFADIMPSEKQENWNDPVEPWGVPAAELILTQQEAKKAMSLVLKKRDPAAQVIVICDAGGEDRRAVSVAMAICDMMHLPREQTIWRTEMPTWQATKTTEAPNRHVFLTMKQARGAVIA